MTHDIVIRGGQVVDGLGGEPVNADVAIDGDRVVAVGSVDGTGKREIAADGALVTPGFVDIHTHLDAQLAWDPQGSSSCWHGVTSVVLGNCGVTFAPCKPEDREYLAKMMESVEDIPADSIMSGLDWSWESYGEYLQALDRMPKGLNVGGMVGHCAVRYHAMGERSLGEEPATDDDIERMRALVDEAMASGALGFSTSRTALHRVPDGRAVPGTYADDRELHGIVDALRKHGKGVFEAAPKLGEKDGPGLPKTVAEVEMLGDVALAAGRPLTFGYTQTKLRPDLHRIVLDTVVKLRERGAQVRPQTTARGIGIIFSIVNLTPWGHFAPKWQALRRLDLADRLAAFRDPQQRAELIEDAIAHPSALAMEDLFVLPEGDAKYVLGSDDSLAAHAARRGVSAPDAFIALTLERDGRLLVNWPFLNDDITAVEEMLRHPATVLGLADAGAHVGQIMDSSQATFFLTHWVRDRGFCSIGDAIRRLTSDTADLFGIRDRGVLRPGAYADVNVIDLDGLRLPQPEYVYDFPGGAGRYVQKASGYVATVVNGQVFMEGGEHSGALAGTVLRS
jgi:N-acyl-D-aspartate/D-glutamate deacylase